ncbi:MAG: transglutaminase domain-containing protein [Pirellulaceae bacterium]|nr:transglutaminase domain-containing protein [Pirellulaceae bacterium]
MIATAIRKKRVLASADWLWPIFFAFLGMLGILSFRSTCQTRPYVIWLDLLILLGLLSLLVLLNLRSGRTTGKVSWHLQLMIGVIVLWPLLTAYLTRWFGIGDPWEVTLLCMLQNAALCCAVLSQRRRLGQFAVVFSGFLLLFLGFVFVSPAMTVILSIFGVAILWWLMEQYWSRAQGAMPMSERRVIPLKRSTLVSVVVLIGLVILIATGLAPRGALVTLSGFMPTSGGDRWGDRFARDGSGSGEILTGAINNATTIAPVDTDVYLSSQQPSMYDMVSKAYGKPSKQRDRKIAVDGANKDVHLHEKMQELVASRQFSVIRHFAEQGREHKRRKSDALLFVSGAEPMHLRLQTFDKFDGVEWQVCDNGPLFEFSMRELNGEPWFHLTRPASNELFKSYHAHELQFVNLKSNRIPTPSMLTAWRIPKIDQGDFYAWTHDDVLEMTGRERIPATTKIGIVFNGVDRYGLHQHVNWPSSNRSDSVEVYFGTDWIPEDIRSLPRSMLQLEAIENFFRSQFVYDPELTAPEDCLDIVSFLLTAKRGPDYMFATAAAISLRELGYQTRLVQGLIAEPKNYDRESKLTIIGPDGVHTWLEVCVDGVNWIPLEPTPGFSLPRRELNWYQAFMLWLDFARRWAIANWALLAVVAVALVGFVWQRRRVYDFISWIVWEFAKRLCSPRRAMLVSERIVSTRLRLAGLACPATLSLRGWLVSLAVNGDSWRPYVDELDRLHYQPGYQISADSCSSKLAMAQVVLSEFKSASIFAQQRRKTKGQQNGKIRLQPAMTSF